MAKEIVFAEAEWIPLENLVFDEKYQMRQDLPSVSDYEDMLKVSGQDEWPFRDPIQVASLRGKLYVVSGFTRGRAAQNAEREHVLCEVAECTPTDAFKLALGANAEHGFRRTNADKRKAVLKAVGKWPNYSSRQVAALCKVSHTYVVKLINALKEQEQEEPGEYEEVPDEPSTLAKGELCPRCAVDEWVEHDHGVSCAVCNQPFGEPVGDDDDAPQVPGDESTEYEDAGLDMGGGGTAVLAPPKVNGKVAGMVDLRKDSIVKAKAELGRLVRSMEQLGLYAASKPHLDAIQNALSKAK